MNLTSSSSANLGVLPSQDVRRLIAEGGIVAPKSMPIEESQVQPASLDLRLSDEMWRMRAGFAPREGGDIERRLDDRSSESLVMHRVSLEDSAPLESGCVYLARLAESLNLPEDVSAVANPKSSTGRIDAFSRMLCDDPRRADLFSRLLRDHGGVFDRAPAGYRGPLWLEISPRTFSILARRGTRLAQLRFRREGERGERDEEATRETRVSVDLGGGGSGTAGYVAKPHAPMIDADAAGLYRASDYWDAIPSCERLILEPGRFYILSSRESVRIGAEEAAEMVAFDPSLGEFRVHYAGFFDPGFGDASVGGEGSKAVLEVRCHETPFALEHGQVVGRLVYEPMSAIPDVLYGASGSHYQGQGLRLSRHFRAER